MDTIRDKENLENLIKKNYFHRMKNRILVVGGSGFLGHNLLKKISLLRNFKIFSLTKSNYERKRKIKNVKYISCDIRKLNDLKRKISKKNYDYVINFSGNINHKKIMKIFKVHYGGLNNLLKIINLKKLELFLQIGSCLEYGRKSSPQKRKFFFVNQYLIMEKRNIWHRIYYKKK